MSASLFVRGGTALTMNEALDVVTNALVHIEGGRIVSITKGGVPPVGACVLDASGSLILPGLVNGHTHAGMSLLRGTADDMPLEKWLNERIFPLERRWVAPEFVSLGTRLAAIEMIRGGTTTFCDMYYLAEETANASHEAGLRAIVGQAFTHGVTPNAETFLEDFEAFRETCGRYPLAVPAIAPHGVYDVSREMWEKIVRFASDRSVRIVTHVAETQAEVEYSFREHGVSPVEFFEQLGLWEMGAIGAHAACLGENDIAILGKRRAGLVHNPQSNMKLGTRIAPVAELRRAGAMLALGTDGTASNNDLDLLAEADMAAKLQSFKDGAGALRAVELVKLLTIEGARALGLGETVGSLEPGKQADLIVLDLERANAVPLYNPYSHIVYSAVAADVRHTIVAGRVLMEDRRVLTLDEKAILAESREWGNRIAAQAL